MECYFKWCEHHCKDEPFCTNGECTATKENVIIFMDLRKKELEDYKIIPA